MRKSITLILLFAAASIWAQNPIIRDQFTADPTARVFDGKVYMYPSHDITSPIERLKDWFCMADYHVFSSSNLVDWTDHGMILSQDDVAWVEPQSYAMWAPDCVEKSGRYYFYFPAQPQGQRGFGIGVAQADNPAGPFVPMDKPIAGVMGIDPCVLIDDDGASYIYWSGMGLRGAKLKDNMTELDGEPAVMKGLPEGFKEGPFAFKRDGRYYLTFPWVREENGTETLAYAMSDNPLGPWNFKGLIMAEHPSKCWTNHHSLVEYQDQWYLFYHHNDYSPSFDKNRSVRIDRICFNPDGTICPVKPTLRGVGVADAFQPLQIDRYSEISPTGAAIEWLDPAEPFKGWHVAFAQDGAWVRFDNVGFDFSPIGVRMRCRAAEDAIVQLAAMKPDGTIQVIGSIAIPTSEDWMTVPMDIEDFNPEGNSNLRVKLLSGKADVDYVQFVAH